MTNLEIDETSFNSPLPHERTYLFNRFLAFRDLGPNRNYKDAIHYMKTHNDSQKYGKDEKLTDTAIRKNSETWMWVARAELWDANNILQQQLKKEETFDNVNESLIQLWEMVVQNMQDILKKIFNQPLKNDGSLYALPTIIKMVKDSVDILKICNEQIRICCGYHPQNDINIKHSGNVQVENKWDTLEIDDTEALRIIHDTFNS